MRWGMGDGGIGELAADFERFSLGISFFMSPKTELDRDSWILQTPLSLYILLTVGLSRFFKILVVLEKNRPIVIQEEEDPKGPSRNQQT